MGTELLIQDRTTDGKVTNELVVDFLEERITVRELIRSRVYQEVKDYNLKQPEYFHGLVEPAEAERTLNGLRLPKKKVVDWKKQYDLAIEAFEHNGFILLVNDRQVENLDEEIHLGAGAKVSFLKLIPLVGG
jgi:hypothetical protein